MTSTVETEQLFSNNFVFIVPFVVTILHQFSVLIPLLHYLAEKHDVVLFLQGNAATYRITVRWYISISTQTQIISVHNAERVIKIGQQSPKL